MKTSFTRTALLASVLAGSLFTSVYAAEETKPEGQPPAQRRERAEALKERLGLTDEQVAQIKPILQAQMEAMRALREDTALTPEQKREKMQAIRAETREKLKGILTEEQLAKFDERRQRGPGAQGGEGEPRKERPSDGQ